MATQFNVIYKNSEARLLLQAQSLSCVIAISSFRSDFFNQQTAARKMKVADMSSVASIFGHNNFLWQQNSISRRTVSEEANQTRFVANDNVINCLSCA